MKKKETTAVAERLLTKNTACLIQRMTEHAAHDEIIQGVGWDEGKGCFVGCCLHNYDHSRFPDQLGWPEQLSHLCDAIFEALPNAKAKEFAVDVPNAVGEDGKDLSMVVPQWIYWTLSDEGSKPTKYPQFQPFIDAVMAIYEEWTRTGARPSTDRADMADMAYLADRADMADMAFLAYRADRAYRAYRAWGADRAYRADLADLAYRADLASDKLLELLRNAPKVGGAK